MPYDHRIPTNLTPSGTLVVPLFIPHDEQWTGLLLGVLRELEEVERYQRDPNYDDENAKIVAGQWRDRTITPLIEAIASGAGVIKHSLGVIVLGANQTRANATFAVVTGSTFAHTFTKKNAKITISNILASVANTTNDGLLRIALSTGSFLWQPYTNVPSTTGRLYRVAAVWQDLTLGVSTNINLEFASAGATQITITAVQQMLVEIEEWD